MVKEEWRVRTIAGDFQAIAHKFGIDPVTARVLVNRGLKEDADFERFLHGTRADLYAPFLLKDMEKAVMLLLQYLKTEEHVRIIGDYDIDGVTSSFILRQGFLTYTERVKSKTKISVAIPHRMRDGYGLNERLVREAHEDGVNVIVTCDNGIAAKAQIELAASLGIRVIVTDHHEVPYETDANGEKHYILPAAAEAIVDPKQEDCTYPFPEICGAMVAYKLILGLMEKAGISMPSDLADDLFAFAAIGTVGDVMPLAGENYLAVKYGLRAVEHCHNVGLRALIRACELEGKHITAYHVGFILGPCFNAAGRLQSAEDVLELLVAESETEAAIKAEKLRALNESRKLMTEEGVEQAISMIEGEGDDIPAVLVVFLPGVHESLAGIIAGRLRERYYRPVYVVTEGGDGLKGSGRSIDEYHMFEEMNRVKEHFKKFGGHKLAAGFTLADNDVDGFRRDLNAACSLDPENLTRKIYIDVPMPIDYASMRLAEQLRALEPFGTGNPAPLFAHRNAIVSEGRKVGRSGNAYKMTVKSDAGASLDAIYFGDVDALLELLSQKGNRCDMIYTLEVNEFRQERTLQAVVKYVK
ncbi:MAG: single-stranded-DNA-specific exonuclease RecJ [Lachnospiraceae bacterium]|nr:single-stranded-DNA-specific exonuclease RecJ [Lachnospiraceae bacterium]